jgi:hypothetical protein
MKKLILFGLGGVIVLVVAAALIAINMIDSIAKRAIETGGTHAMGTTTKVADVDVGLFSGQFAMTGLHVANPAGGFQSPHFLKLGDGSVAVSFRTLRQPTVELPHLKLSNIDVNLEKRNGQTNFGTILESLKQKTGGGGDKPRPASDEKRFIIHDLDIQNVTVRVDLVGGPGAVGELTKVTVPIDRIKLSDVGKTGEGVAGSGVTMEELAAIIVKAVLAAATEKGGGLIPADVLNDLQARLAAFGDLDRLKMEVTAAAKGKIEELGKKAEEEAKKKLDEVAEKLKGLIPADKGKK